MNLKYHFVDCDNVAHLPAQGSSCPVVQDPRKNISNINETKHFKKTNSKTSDNVPVITWCFTPGSL